MLSGDEIACWLLKTARSPAEIAPDWAPGGSRRLRRCLRRSYRLGLMEPGQRCVLWLSGRQGPGVHALGTLLDAPDPADGELEVLLHLLAEPAPRAELLAHPGFCTAEVLRMPAGSNPSFLRAAELDAVLELLDPAATRAAGWLDAGRTRS